jgi:DedD protein
MAEENERSRDRFDLSLDGRQIASIVVGALVILGVVFVLGLNVGRQLPVREQGGGAGDTLAGLDQSPVPPAEPMRDEELTYDEKLTRPSPAPIAPAAAASVSPAPAPPAAAPPATAAAATPSSTTATPAPNATQAPTPPAAAPSPRPSAVATVSRTPAPSTSTSTSDAWTIQVGSAQDRAEASRLAKRFERWSARVETAELGSRGRWYRVRVGRYASRETAERFLRDLQRETGAKGYVTSAL